MRFELQPVSGRVLLYAGFSPKMNECMRLVPGNAFNRKRKAWEGYPDAIEAALTLAKGQIRDDPTTVLNQLARLHDMQPAIAPENTGRNYQSLGIGWLRSVRQGLLADEMGVGKTAQAVVAAKGLGKSTLIVCHTNSIQVWMREIQKWWPQPVHEFRIMRCTGIKPLHIHPDTEIVICHYGILRCWCRAISEWGPQIMIADEGQALMTEESKRTEAFRAIRELIQNPYVWILTGTPIPNRVRDLYSILQCITPGRFGKSFFDFGRRYCNGQPVWVDAINKTVWNFDGASHGEELARRMSWMTLRRTKDEVKLELPAKTRQVLWVEPKEVKGLKIPPGASRAMLSGVLQAVGNAKLRDGIEIISQRAQDSGGRTVVFVWRQNVAEFVGATLYEAGFHIEIVHGGMPIKKREEALDRAKTGPTPHVTVATFDTCGVSIDMSWATLGIVLEISPEPYKLLQIEDRLHRFPQTEPVTIIYIAARQSIDERIVSLVVEKLGGQAPLLAVSATNRVETALEPKLDDEAILREILGT